MRTITRSTVALSLLLSLALAGCGGGRGATALPSNPANGTAGTGGTGSSSAQRAPATLTFTIPGGGSTSAAKRSVKYISAATKSITVSVVPSNTTTATPTTAEVDVNATNCTTASTGAESCAVTVQAPIGSDVFTVTMYDQTGGSGNVLSTGTMTASVIAHAANSFPLTLGGAIASLIVTLANAYLPVVDGGTTAVFVTAKDASGNTIVGTYAAPVTVALPAGLTAASGTTTLQSSSDALTVAYNGASKTALAITATSGSVSGAASVVPTTNVHTYTLAQTQAASGASDPFRLVKGPDGAIYFADIGATQVSGNLASGTQAGAVGRLDPTTGVITEIAIAGIDPISLHFFGNDLYVAEEQSGTLGRITNAAAGGFTESNYTQLPLPNSPPSGTLASGSTTYDAPRDITSDAANLYITTWSHRGVLTFDPTTLAATEVTGSNRGSTAGIVESNGTLSFAETSSGAGSYVPGASTLTNLGYVGAGAGYFNGTTDTYGGSTRFAALGSDGNVYLTLLNAGDAVNPGGIVKMVPGATPTFSWLPIPLPGWGPDSIHASGTNLVAGDLGTGAIDVYSLSSGNYTIYPLAAAQDNAATGASDVADNGDGSYYFTYGITALTAPSATVSIGRLVLAQGWQLLPGASQQIDGLGVSGAVLVGVAQAPGQNDTVVVASTTPSICTTAKAPATTNLYTVTGLAAGACVVTATDENNRVVTENITVTASSATISSHRRIAR